MLDSRLSTCNALYNSPCALSALPAWCQLGASLVPAWSPDDDVTNMDTIADTSAFLVTDTATVRLAWRS